MPDKNGFESLVHLNGEPRCIWCGWEPGFSVSVKALERHAKKHSGDRTAAEARQKEFIQRVVAQ